MRKEIRIAGYGGQGVVLAGIIIGTAAAIYESIHALQTQTYGAASRGGAARSDVIISDEQIVYPQVSHPDILACLSQDAWDKYGKNLKTDGILIIDPDLVKIPDNTGLKVFDIKATDIASNDFKKPILANMVMLGYINAVTEILSCGSMEKAIADNVPKGTEAMNIDAFRTGFSGFVKNSSN